MADRLYTSKEANELITGLRTETKLDKFIIAKMAFAISLSKERNNVPNSFDFGGGEMKRPTFFGEDETFIRTLIQYVYQKKELTEEELYSNKSIIKNHVDSGAKILWSLFEQNGHDVNRWYEEVINASGITDGGGYLTKDLDVFIGRKLINNEEVILELNNTAKHANSHLAIMGKPGVGKTQFLLKILADIRVQSNFQTNFILFDYKGDVVSNETFNEVAKTRVYKLLQGNEVLPINPFVLPTYDEQAIKLSAREKAESFASINSKLGVVQTGFLTEAIEVAYSRRANSDTPYPDFNDVLSIANSIYEEKRKTPDSLIGILRDLANFNLFWSYGSGIKPLDKLTNKTMLIDLHSMVVLKELVVYLIIERIYKEMSQLPDSAIKDNRRMIRTILVIDEAHNYLAQKNIFLQRIIREGRSKGIVVFFASQSPSDYQQKFFNFQELLEFVYIFQCEGVAPSDIQDILGCSQKTARDLQVEIARLENFQVIARSNIKTEEYMKFNATPFYKSY